MSKSSLEVVVWVCVLVVDASTEARFCGEEDAFGFGSDGDDAVVGFVIILVRETEWKVSSAYVGGGVWYSLGYSEEEDMMDVTSSNRFSKCGLGTTRLVSML